MIKVLCLIDHYLPGFKAGGPIKSISNLVKNINSNNIRFNIITRDRDFKDLVSYKNINFNTWISKDNHEIYYLKKSKNSYFLIFNLIRKRNHDALYLNSFFSFKFTTFPLILRKLKLYKGSNVIIATRGEFSPEALKIKSFKKKIFITIFKAFGFYNDLKWQASSIKEKNDINKIFGNNIKVHITSNIVTLDKFEPQYKINLKIKNTLNIIFLSRISPMKNLDFLIKVLILIDKEYNINLNIYGSIDDQKYWQYCLVLLNNLPNNVKAIYHGEVKPELVRLKFDQNDVFVLPTRGENFGHVILESLSTYTPIILSDNTPWVDAENQAIRIISLFEKLSWKNKIEEFASLDNNEIEQVRIKTKIYYNNFVTTNNAMSSHMDLFSI